VAMICHEQLGMSVSYGFTSNETWAAWAVCGVCGCVRRVCVNLAKPIKSVVRLYHPLGGRATPTTTDRHAKPDGTYASPKQRARRCQPHPSPPCTGPPGAPGCCCFRVRVKGGCQIQIPKGHEGRPRMLFPPPALSLAFSQHTGQDIRQEWIDVSTYRRRVGPPKQAGARRRTAQASVDSLPFMLLAGTD
jgi:hypothetical protein